LEATFSAAIPHVTDILAAFDHNHPVIESFMQFFANKTIDIHREAGEWMCSLCLVPTPELEAVFMEHLGNLLKHELLADLLQPERHRWVVAVGSALFQLLAVQHMLGEKLSLNSSILSDLALGDVVPRPSARPEALAAMFAAVPSSAAHSGCISRRVLSGYGSVTATRELGGFGQIEWCFTSKMTSEFLFILVL
jgi:hypothetical protein